MELSRADHSVSPPRIEVPRAYNAAYDLIERNLAARRGAKAAFHDDAGTLTYARLAERVNRFGSGLLAMGLRMEDRVLLAMHDTNDWPVAFLGAIAKRPAVVRSGPAATRLTRTPRGPRSRAR